MAAKRTMQLALFAEATPATPTDARATDAERKKIESDKARRAFFAGRARGRAEASPAPAEPVDPELREKVLGMLCSESTSIADVARRARVSVDVVRSLVCEQFDKRRAVRSAVDIVRALEREPITRRAPRVRRTSARREPVAPDA